MNFQYDAISISPLPMKGKSRSNGCSQLFPE